jgi:TPR repeat protein
MYSTGDGVAQNYQEAAAWFRKAAYQGYAESENELGVMFALGQGLPQDFAEAVKWFRKAADKGSATGQFNLGQAYSQGRGVPQDDDLAETWFRKAAEQGYAAAQNNLAMLLTKSWWTTLVGNAEAVKWYHAAAEQGLPEAQYNLGSMYATGRWVPSDNVQAYVWFDLAARAFSDRAKQEDAIQQRGIIASEMTSKQLAEAMRLAREWKPKIETP